MNSLMTGRTLQKVGQIIFKIHPFLSFEVFLLPVLHGCLFEHLVQNKVTFTVVLVWDWEGQSCYTVQAAHKLLLPQLPEQAGCK